MRIGIEAQRIFREKKHGMDIVVLELIRSLQQIDTINEYFIFVKHGPDESCLTETKNFKIIKVPGFTYADWEQISLPIFVAAKKLDVLHCTSNTAPWLGSTPIILTLHDVIFLEENIPHTVMRNAYQEFGRIYRKKVVPFSVKKAMKIITVSNYEKQRIIEVLGVNNDKIEVVYNAFGKHFEGKLKTAISPVLDKYKLPNKYIFYIGNSDPKKNMFNTFEAYVDYLKQETNPLPLVIADVTKELLALTLEVLNVKQFAKYFILTGYINNADLPFIYAGATVFLYPSIRESFGIPILESMACGTPVISSATSAIPEISADAAMLIQPDNVFQISEALTMVIKKEELRKVMIAKGEKRIQSFSWLASAEQLLANYKSAL